MGGTGGLSTRARRSGLRPRRRRRQSERKGRWEQPATALHLLPPRLLFEVRCRTRQVGWHALGSLDDFRLRRQFLLRIADDAFRLVSRQLLLRVAEPFAEDRVVAGAQRQAGLERPALRPFEDEGRVGQGDTAKL